MKIVVHRCASQLPEQRPTGTVNARAEIIIYIFIMFAQEPEIPGNEIQEEWSFFKCKAISYPTTNFCQKKCESCDKCQEVKPCLEFLMFGTGPVTHAESFDNHNRFACSKLITNGTDISEEEFESEALPKNSCHMVTDEGIEVNFLIGKDTIYRVESITCPNTSVSKFCSI